MGFRTWTWRVSEVFGEGLVSDLKREKTSPEPALSLGSKRAMPEDSELRHTLVAGDIPTEEGRRIH